MDLSKARKYMSPEDIEDALTTVTSSMREGHTSRMMQLDDSVSVMRNPTFINYSQMKNIADTSPTAKNYVAARNCFEQAWGLLEGPGSPKPYSNIQGVYLFLEGIMFENSLACSYPWHEEKMVRFLEEHMRCNPCDFAVRFVHYWFHWKKPSYPDEKKIREIEILGHDVEEDASGLDKNRKLLRLVYYMAAGLYTTTDQPQRAIQMFQKCISLDSEDFDAYYGVGFNLASQADERHSSKSGNSSTPIMNKEAAELRRESIRVCEKYLSLAPPCDKHYPAVLYDLARAHLLLANSKEFVVYYERAVAAEEQNLPFSREASHPMKKMLSVVYKGARKLVCFNPSCPHPQGTELKCCSACREAFYCGIECQTEHRPNHKKICKKLRLSFAK